MQTQFKSLKTSYVIRPDELNDEWQATGLDLLQPQRSYLREVAQELCQRMKGINLCELN